MPFSTTDQLTFSHATPRRAPNVWFHRIEWVTNLEEQLSWEPTDSQSDVRTLVLPRRGESRTKRAAQTRKPESEPATDPMLERVGPEERYALHGELARGGMITWYEPGTAGCYRCLNSHRYEQNVEVDLPAARGGIFDQRFIESVAFKIGMALLDKGQESESGFWRCSIPARPILSFIT